jgi:hypothetical protein
MFRSNSTWKQVKSSLSPAQLIGASIQSFVMWIAARLLLLGLGINPPREWLFFVSVLVAAFFIVLVISTILGRDNRPCFTGEFAAVTIGEMEAIISPANSTIRETISFVSPVLDISNTGAPSIAKGYRLTVIFSDGTSKAGEPFTPISAGPIAFTHPSGTSEVFGYDDLLLRKSLLPIPRGGFVQGRLLFRLRGLSPSDLRTIGTTFRIEFFDLWGKAYTTEFKCTSREDSLLHFAGMNAAQLAMAQPELELIPPTSAKPPLSVPNMEASPPS